MDGDGLEQSGGVGDIVCGAIGGEEKGRNGGVARVVMGCRPVLEEVEEGEGGEEEGGAPEWGVIREAEKDRQEESHAKGVAQKKGS